MKNIGLEMSNQNPKAKHDALLTIKDPKERARQVALWACTFGWGEMIPEIIPTEPKALSEWKGMGTAMREANKALIDNDLVQRYLDNKIFKIATMRDTVEWLHEMHESLDEKLDPVYRLNIRVRIDEFRDYYDKNKDIKTRPEFKLPKLKEGLYG